VSRSLRRGAIAALVLAITTPLSACAATSDAETLQVKPDNAATSIGNDLKLNNILLITQPGGVAAETETRPAAVSVNISNTGAKAETLTGVAVGDAGAAEFTGPNGDRVNSITVPAGGSVLIGGPGQPTLQVPDAKVEEGGFSKVTFAFDSAGSVDTEASVVTGSGLYASFAPTTPAAPSAAPSVSPSVTPGATAEASGSAASGTGTASASASASQG